MILTATPLGQFDKPMALAIMRAIAAGMPYDASSVISGYRSLATNTALFLSRYAVSSGPMDRGPFGDRRGPFQGHYWKRMRSLPVAVPSTSLHEDGLAFDVRPGTPMWDWLVSEGAAFGFTHPLPTDDPPHIEYHAVRDTTPATPAPAFSAKEDNDMPKNYNAGGTIFTLGETFGIVWPDTTSFSYGTNMAAWGEPITSAMTFDQVKTVVGEANARGAAYAASGSGASIDLDVLAAKIDALATKRPAPTVTVDVQASRKTV